MSVIQFFLASVVKETQTTKQAAARWQLCFNYFCCSLANDHNISGNERKQPWRPSFSLRYEHSVAAVGLLLRPQLELGFLSDARHSLHEARLLLFVQVQNVPKKIMHFNTISTQLTSKCAKRPSPSSLPPTPSRENTLHSNYAVVLATVLSPWQQGTIKNPHLAVSTTSAASGAAICLSAGSNWCTQLWSGVEQAASLLVCSDEAFTTSAISIMAEERQGSVIVTPRSPGREVEAAEKVAVLDFFRQLVKWVQRQEVDGDPPRLQ